MTDKELKFRAVIVEKKATIYFTIRDLVDVKNHLFSTRELLIPYLLAGNKPDRFTGLTDRKEREIYEGDIIKGGGLGNQIVRFGKYDNKERYEDSRTGIGFYLESIKDKRLYGGFELYRLFAPLEVIGSIYERKWLLEERK